MADVDTACILIADDDAARRHATCRAFQEAGFGTVEAESVPEALQLAQNGPRLAVLPSSLSGIQAPSLCTELRANPMTASLPIVQLVGPDTGSAGRIACLRAGADSCLPLPVEPAELVAAVGAVLRRQVNGAALRESEERYRDLVENCADLLCTHDLEGHVLWVNEAATRLSGYPRDAILRMNIGDLFSPELGAEFQSYLNEIKTNGRSKGLMRVLTAGGETRFWEYNNTLGTGWGGEPVVRGIAHDITEWMAAERALRTTERRLNRAQEQAGIGSWEYDVRQRRRWWSRHMFRMFGLEPADEAPAFEDYLQRLHPQDRRSVERALAKLAAGVGPTLAEFRSDPADGSVRTFLPTWSCERDPDGRPTRFWGTVLDITERKRMEEALLDITPRYRALFDANPHPMWVYDLETLRFLAVNDAAVSHYGYSQDEFLGMTIEDIRPPEELTRLRENLARQPVEGVDTPGIWLHRKRDGTLIDVDITVHQLEFDARPAKLVLAHDVTDTRRAEQALRESEERYRLLVDQSPYAISIHQDGVIIFANPAAVSLAGGGTPEDLIGRPMRSFVHPETWPAAAERISRTLDGDVRAFPAEDRHVRLDGSEVAVEVTAVPFTLGGRPAVQVIALDITARKRAEAELRESERRLREMLEDVQLVGLMLDTEGRITFCNDYLLSLTGWRREELLGTEWFPRFVPQDWEQANATFRVAMETGALPPHYENPILTRSGERRWIVFSNTVLRDPEGRVVGAASLGEDVTARRLAEDALRESEASYRTLVESASDGIFIADNLGHYTDVNAAGCAMLGYTRKALLGMTITDIVDTSETARVAPELSALPTRELKRSQWQFRRKDGTVFPGEVSVTALPDGRFLGVLRDISERATAQAALRDMQERLQQAIHGGQVGLWDWDLQTNLVRYSPEWKRQIGYDESEISDSYDEWETRLHPDDLDRTRKHVDDYLRGARPAYEVEFRLRHKDGSYRNILARGSAIMGSAGQPVRLIGSHVDISERTQLEARFLQAQKMESVGQLAGGIAHDFNNLLTVINGTADLAAAKLRKGDPLHSDLDEILRAGERAAALTRQLLAFSRQQIMRPVVLDLGQLVADMEDMLRRLIGEDIELVVLPAAGARSVLADPVQIEQVIMNLAVNARDAMTTGGTLTIQTETVVVDGGFLEEHPTATRGPHVVLTVRDTGTGMDAATLVRIFEPFYTTKELGKGTGLGLSTVYGIVEQSAGVITVESEPGSGTAFRIYLPRAEDSAKVAGPESFSPPATGGETVLIVEDYLPLRELAKRMLVGAGYTVLSAANGEEALGLLERHPGPVHLLMTDVVMPGMGGLDLARRVTEAQPDTQVLYTSGFTDDALLRHGLLVDAAHFIGKPYSYDELARTVRAALDAGAGTRQ